MIPITIPKHLLKERDFVLIPRKQLEELIRAAKKYHGSATLTPNQKKALQSARENRKKGNILNLYDLKRAVVTPS